MIIVNDQRIDPMPVITGKEKYPDNIIQQLKAARRNVYAIDALETAKELGNIKALNIVMVGFLARKPEFQRKHGMKPFGKMSGPVLWT